MSDADGPPADTDLLLSYCRQRDVEAFRVILDRHQGDLLRFAHSLLADSHAAQDAVQEAFCRLCREADRLLAKESSGSLGGWLCTVVRNTCIDHLRRRGTAVMTPLDDIHGDPQPTPAVAVAEQEAGESLWRAVGTLPPLERAAVVLRYRDGLSYQDIAAKLNKTATHVGVLLHQALGRLRQDAALKEGVANG